MKTIVISALFFVTLITLLNHNSYCQTEKGNILLGGSMGFSNSKGGVDSDQKNFTLYFNPSVSYLIMDRLMIGVIVPINYGESSNSFGNFKTFRYSFGPKIRYYFPIGVVAIFPEVSYTIGQEKYEIPSINPISGDINKSNDKYDLTDFKAGIGLTYFINSHIGLEGILSYRRIKRKEEDLFLGDFDLSMINFNVGFKIYFQTRNKE